MGQAYAPHYCPDCRKAVMAVRLTPNHALHVLLSLGTMGLLLLVWIGITLFRFGRFRCPTCRSATVPSVPGFRPAAEHRPAFSLKTMVY